MYANSIGRVFLGQSMRVFMLTVFLSYSRHDDQRWVDKVRNDLQNAGFIVWQDKQNMRGGKSWREQVGDSLKAVDAVVVLLSLNATNSEIVTWEWQTALIIKKTVIPFIIETCDIPAMLKPLHYRNGNNPDDFVKLIGDLNSLHTEKKAELQDQSQPSNQVLGGFYQPNWTVSGGVHITNQQNSRVESTKDDKG